MRKRAGNSKRSGEVAAELLKLGAVLMLGVLVTPTSWGDPGIAAWAFAVLVPVAVRPFSLLPSLLSSPPDHRERLAAAWFGPKGFAAVAYTLLVHRSGIADARHIHHLLALVITTSIIAHSSSDVLVARWFREPAATTERGYPGSSEVPS